MAEIINLERNGFRLNAVHIVFIIGSFLMGIVLTAGVKLGTNDTNLVNLTSKVSEIGAKVDSLKESNSQKSITEAEQFQSMKDQIASLQTEVAELKMKVDNSKLGKVAYEVIAQTTQQSYY